MGPLMRSRNENCNSKLRFSILTYLVESRSNPTLPVIPDFKRPAEETDKLTSLSGDETSCN